MKEFLNKNKSKKLNLKDPCKIEFNQILAEFIIGANVAINTLDNPFFAYFIHKYCPIYTLPSRTYFTRNIIDEVQIQVDSKIRYTCHYKLSFIYLRYLDRTACT